MLQNLSNNLYSRFVTVSADKVKELENHLSMEVKRFNSDFNQNLNALKHIEEQFMQKLEAIVELPDGLYKIEDTDQLMQNPLESK